MAKKQPTWFDQVTRVSKHLAIVVAVLSSLSAISGAAWSLFEFARATRDKARVAQIAQLTSYASFGELLKRYHEIEEKTDAFLRVHRRTNWTAKANELLKKYETGASMYYSPDLRDFRYIHQFYEELGTIIRFNAVDFELVFQLVTFPSDFYENTKPLQDFLSNHWFELREEPKKRILEDFGFNLQELSRNYEARRKNQPLSWSKP